MPDNNIFRDCIPALMTPCSRHGVPNALRVLSTFDEGPDLVLYYKRLMVLEGHRDYEHHPNSSDALSPSQREFIDKQWRLFKTWWDQWPGR